MIYLLNFNYAVLHYTWQASEIVSEGSWD